MLCSIRASDNCKAFAITSDKGSGPFICPKCRQEVVIKKGRIKTHHFAHKPPVTCWHGKGETEEHRSCKIGIYNSLSKKENVTELEVEKDFGKVVADVYCHIDTMPVAIEVQRSDLSVSKIAQRTEEYARLGIHVLWIGLSCNNSRKNPYSPKAWEKWLHAAYMGRCYYWVTDDIVLPVHFDAHKIYVEATEWYDSEGNHQYAGGYERFSKRYRNPIAARMLSIANDFMAINKAAWNKGSTYIPDCRLWIDRTPRWW